MLTVHLELLRFFFFLKKGQCWDLIMSRDSIGAGQLVFWGLNLMMLQSRQLLARTEDGGWLDEFVASPSKICHLLTSGNCLLLAEGLSSLPHRPLHGVDLKM